MLTSGAGRARQMNAGAKAATGQHSIGSDSFVYVLIMSALVCQVLGASRPADWHTATIFPMSRVQP